jgi:uncharacterized protein YjhX (UPF0386 family)
VATTFHGKGVFPDDHPLALGAVGFMRHDHVNFGFDRADLIIAVGYELQEFDPVRINPQGNTKIIHLHRFPAEVDGHYDVAVGLHSDIGRSLDALADAAGPRAAVAAGRDRIRTSQDVRDRLVHLDALVQAALDDPKLKVSPGGAAAGELTWRLLSSLQAPEMRLEGADESDQVTAVGQLRAVTRDGSAASAAALFGQLAILADKYAPAGAEVTELMLRRDLSGTPLARSPSYQRAWEILDGLAGRLRDRTRSHLADASAQVTLDRSAERDALSEADVFAAVWHRLVRRREVTSRGGPTPDAREQAMLSLARRALLPASPAGPPDPAALPSLRSDGLVISAGPASAWLPGDQFASDLVRDLAVARLLITGGWDLLDQADAPRWAPRGDHRSCRIRRAPKTEARCHVVAVRCGRPDFIQ